MKAIKHLITLGVFLTAFLVCGMALANDLSIFDSVSTDSALEVPKLTVTITGNQVTLSWNKVTGATNYVVHYAQKPYDNPDTIKTIDVGDKTTAAYELSPGSSYHVAVKACKNSGSDCSDYSNIHDVIIPLVSTFKNSLGQEFKLIPAGTFTMGGSGSDETQHQVTLTKVFYIQTTEVTQGQWKEIMDSNHSKFKYGDDWPWDNYTYYSGDKLTWVSWPEVQDFIKKLNEREKTQKYRLPTEAEWEYACRAGTTGWFAFRPYAPSIWYDANSDKRTHRVAKKPANAWGLYDMHGNVREWVQDWYGPYPSVPVTDPKGPTKGTKRVFRGGAFKDGHGNCRSAYRGKDGPDDQGYWEAWPVGFRVAADPVK